jgi:ribose transport system substrate-binding protein
MRFTTTRTLLLAGVVAAAVLVAGVVGATAASQTLKGKKVGVIVCTSSNPFCAAWTNSLKTGLQKEGASVEVLTSDFDPSTDAENMNRLIAQKVNLIIMAPASATAIIPSIVRAKAAGIKIEVALGALTPAGAKLVNASVLTNDAELGTYAAENVVAGLKAEGKTSGNVIALTGTATQLNVTDRMAAFTAYMNKYPQYKVVAVEDAQWDQTMSETDTTQLLAKYASQGGIQAAYGMADNQAVGIIQGAQQAGVPVGVANKGLVVVGSNCLSVGIQAIEAGTEYGTGTQAPGVEAAAAVKVAKIILSGGKPPKLTLVKEAKITQANVQKYAKQCTY